MRQTTAAILAILCIVGVVFAYTGGLSTTSASASGNVGGAAIATEDASAVGTPTAPTVPAVAVSLVANSGFIPSQSTITLGHDGFSFSAGSAYMLTIELRGSESDDVAFRVQHTNDPATYGAYSGQVLTTKRGPTGAAYAAVSTNDLTALRDTEGAGWYVFTAQDGSGTVRALPLFIR